VAIVLQRACLFWYVAASQTGIGCVLVLPDVAGKKCICSKVACATHACGRFSIGWEVQASKVLSCKTLLKVGCCA
jgi:hypothetical protein